MSNWKPHSDKQDLAARSRKPIVICGTGIQWGKTAVGANKIAIAMHKFTKPGDNFVITAPTYKIMQQSTLPAFMNVMRSAGRYNAANGEFKMHGGGTAYFRTMTDPDSVVGITDVRFVWGDEAGKYGLYFWENIQARAAFRNAQIILTTSPYSLNWIYKEFIRPKTKDPEARPDCELIQAASWENPFFPEATVERAKTSMDPRRFRMLFGGAWEKMAGLVYDSFHDTENTCEAFELPTGTRLFGGVDFGYTDPFVLIIRAILPSGLHIQVSETYRTGLTITDVVDLCRRKRSVFPFERLYCDPSQPAIIEELCRNGIAAVGADNDIRMGIDRHYELIKTRRFKIFRGTSPHTLDEQEMYHYPEPQDLGPDDKGKEQVPVDQSNHCMDANRYLSMMLHSSGSKSRPHVPEQVAKKSTDPYIRIKQLRKPSRGNKQSENWGD